jgi:hypothetical protein
MFCSAAARDWGAERVREAIFPVVNSRGGSLWAEISRKTVIAAIAARWRWTIYRAMASGTRTSALEVDKWLAVIEKVITLTVVLSMSNWRCYQVL